MKATAPVYMQVEVRLDYFSMGFRGETWEFMTPQGRRRIDIAYGLFQGTETIVTESASREEIARWEELLTAKQALDRVFNTPVTITIPDRLREMIALVKPE